MLYYNSYRIGGKWFRSPQCPASLEAKKRCGIREADLWAGSKLRTAVIALEAEPNSFSSGKTETEDCLLRASLCRDSWIAPVSDPFAGIVQRYQTTRAARPVKEAMVACLRCTALTGRFETRSSSGLAWLCLNASSGVGTGRTRWRHERDRQPRLKAHRTEAPQRRDRRCAPQGRAPTKEQSVSSTSRELRTNYADW